MMNRLSQVQLEQVSVGLHTSGHNVCTRHVGVSLNICTREKINTSTMYHDHNTAATFLLH